MTTTDTRTPEAQLREAVAWLDTLAHHCSGSTTTAWLLRHVEGEGHDHQVMPGGEKDATLLVSLHTGLHSAALEAARNAVIDAEAALADQADDGWPGCDDSCEYEAWLDAQAARGDLAGCPETMACYDCGRAALAAGQPHATDDLGMPYIEQPVTALGPVAEAHRDPTSTYRLACQHIAI